MYSNTYSTKEFFSLNNLDQHFDKQFTFSKYRLDQNQDLNSLFDNQEWKDDNLQLIEEDLLRVKTQLNDFNLTDWSYSTNKWALVDKDDFYGSFINYEKQDDPLERYQEKPELFTRAWLKLYEILFKFNFKHFLNNCLINQDNKINCLFLCEAPGAFVTALNSYLKQNISTSNSLVFNWLATSLNVYHEKSDKDALVEDGFIEKTFRNWYFGEDNTGNIKQPNFHQSLLSEFKKINNQDECKPNELKINLITADGGLQNIQSPAFQEINSYSLIQNEVLVALNCLSDGGCLIVKIFGFFNCRTISLIYLLTCVFENVHLFKPVSSKGGNSEIYVVCLNYQLNQNIQIISKIIERFKSINNLDLIFKKESLPLDFLNAIIDSSMFFANHQTKVIELNIYLSKKNDRKFYSNYKKLQKRANAKFRDLVDLKPIKIKDQIVKEPYEMLSKNVQYYYYGLKKKLIMNFDRPISYSELMKELNEKDAKLNKIHNLMINNVYDLPEIELYNHFNKFHSFDHKIRCLEQLVTQPKDSLQSSPYLNSKLCCGTLIKLSADFESLTKSVHYDHLDTRVKANENKIVNHFKILFRLKLDEIVELTNYQNCQDCSVYLVDHLQINNQSNLSILISESIKELKLDQTKLYNTTDELFNESALIVHLIDLFNLNDEQLLDNEYHLTNFLIRKLIEIFDQLKSHHILVISLPNLFTRYLVGVVYLLTCVFKQFTISPVYLKNHKVLESSLILIFTNKLDRIACSNSLEIDVVGVLRKLNEFNLLENNMQILDFIGIHNLMQHNIDFLQLIILANNMNLIEKMKTKMNL